MYTIETRRTYGSGWLQLGQRRSREDAQWLAIDISRELDRTTRVVRYGKRFELISEHDALGGSIPKREG
ncbi:MAG TPA: hypothetical protein VN663_22740 [Ramlibacter sp.]|nr:hypothetical protein [Ramlibacter sp.]